MDKTFIPREPCSRGHRLRYVSNNQCLECRKLWANGVKRKTYLAYMSKWQKDNHDYREQYKLIWRAANPGLRSFMRSRAKFYVRQATPSWLTKEQRLTILNVYKEAELLTKKTGKVYEVDHCVPLRGRYVSGLHVPWNLTVLLASVNRSKSNRGLYE
ncbi:MAG: hypothetical protein NVS1B10_07620 [Candidatus Saccharimonadales bacterium]